jgi:cytochrome c oxidase subunit 1
MLLFGYLGERGTISSMKGLIIGFVFFAAMLAYMFVYMIPSGAPLAVFAIFAGFYYWLEKIIGLGYSETLGKIHF